MGDIKVLDLLWFDTQKFGGKVDGTKVLVFLDLTLEKFLELEKSWRCIYGKKVFDRYQHGVWSQRFIFFCI
jgi:hypothetical protein